MVKAALVGLFTTLLAISSGNLAAAQSSSVVGTVAPAGTKIKVSTTTATVAPKTTTKATTTATAKTTTTGIKTTATTTGATTAKTTTTTKTTTAPTSAALTKSKSTAATTATTAPKKSLAKSSSTNTRVIRPELPSNGLPNWIGPIVNATTGSACYRKTHRASKTCATGYALDSLNAACWAECPLEYPIQCGMQCLTQNEDCVKATITKVAAVANAALSTASLGVLGQLTTAVKAVDVSLRCGKQLYDIVTKAIEYLNAIEEKQPSTTKQKLFTALMKSDIAVIDLPLAVATCVGSSITDALSTTKDIAGPVKAIVEKIVTQIATIREKALEPKQFVNMTSTAGVARVKKMKALDVNNLGKVVTCGGELKGLVDKVTSKVKELKEKAPTAPLDAIRLALASSELILVDIPEATKNCVPKGTKDFYGVRDKVRRAFGSIVDSAIDASSEAESKAEDAPLKPLTKKQYALKIAGLGLDVIGFFDPTGFAKLIRAYAQKICGPTQFFGEIDDGKLEDALGLNVLGNAFATSNGAYKKKGDGLVKINFISSDTKDVEVNIFSAGQKIGSVVLETNKVVTWTKPMNELQDKTLYLDRWRPGFAKIPGTGGGSLLLWIPHSSQGGHVELHAVLNVS